MSVDGWMVVENGVNGHTKECYWVIKKKKILHLRQHKWHWSHDGVCSKSGGERQVLYMISHTWNPKNRKPTEALEQWLWGAERGGEWGNVGQTVQTLSCQMSKFWRYNVEHSDYS